MIIKQVFTALIIANISRKINKRYYVNDSGLLAEYKSFMYNKDRRISQWKQELKEILKEP